MIQGKGLGSSAAPSVREAAPAKINLTLRVLGRRSDGYHLLQSLVAFAEITDVVEAWPADSWALEITGPFGAALQGEPDNLVLRAARGLATLANIDTPRARLRLTKNLPVASGIGGGSADAAATLRALMTLWGIAPDNRELEALALSLGADVPVCLAGRPAVMSGIGDVLKPLAGLPDLWVLLVNPGIEMPTGPVFEALGLRPGQEVSSGGNEQMQFTDSAALISYLEKHPNELQAPAIGLQPKLQAVIDTLAAYPGCALARMSGSGSTCFGLFDDEIRLNEANAEIASARPEWWTAATKLCG